MNTITTVARREIVVALRNKGIMISLAVLLITIIGGIGLATYFTERDSQPDQVAVVGEALTIPGYETLTVPDYTAAESAVLDGEVVGAVVDGQLLVDGTASPTLFTAVNAAVIPPEVQATLAELSVEAVDISAASASGSDAEGPDTFAAIAVTAVGIALVYMAIMYFAANIGSRITEEKSSRIIEIILASVRPLEFLAGKIIGNVIFGFMATLVLVGVGAVALNVSGLLDGLTFPWSIIPILLVAFLLGMFFYGSLYAAAGALVQRTEDLQSTLLPIIILIMVSIYIPFFGMGSLESQWMQVFSWLPPCSLGLAPIQFAAGNLSAAQLAASYAVMAAVTVGVMWLVARVYRGSILNNGKKMGWLEALRA